MSVQQEQLRMGHSSVSGESAAEQSDQGELTKAHREHPPELEFSMPESEESLTAYLSAIGGAVIGLLLTLLVLAIWNGGTLNFTNTSRVDALEAGLNRVDENLGAVNTNVGTVAERLTALESEAGAISELQSSLTSLDSSLVSLEETLGEQGIRVDELDMAVAELEVTRKNFDTFTAALAQALAEMGAVSAPAAETESAPAEEAAPAAESAAQPETTEMMALAAPMVVSSEDVAAGGILAYLFVDANGDGLLDFEEVALAGTSISLTDADGNTVSAEVSGGSALFSELAPGTYTVTVEDDMGYELASESSVDVTVDEAAETGQIVYFAVSSGE